MTKNALFLIVLLAFLCAGTALAAPVPACTTSMSTSTAVGSLTNGCVDADKTFSSYNVSGASCTGSGCATSTGSNTYMWGSGSIGTGAAAGLAGTMTANFDGAPAGTTAWRLSGGGAVGNPVIDTANISYVVQSNVGAPAGAGLSWVIGGNVGLDLAGSINVTSNSPPTPLATQKIMVTEMFCINAATTVGCSAANTGFLEGMLTLVQSANIPMTVTSFSYVSCSAGANVGSCNGGPTGSSIALSSFLSEVAVSNVFTLSREPNENAVLNLDRISNSFQEFAEGAATPEPGTFALFGAALVGVAALRARRKA